MKKTEAIFKSLADTNRIRIIKLLQGRTLCVCEIAAVLGITQPSVSRHLKKLIGAGLIGCEQDGYWTNYFLAPSHQQAKVVLACMKKWLCDDRTVKKDVEKLKKTDRGCICAKKGVPYGKR